jgi:5-methylthioadenosine/S-adenosylhomocysteine deaminase
MDLLIENVVVVTCDDARTIHQDAAVLVLGDRIAGVGRAEDLARQRPGVARMDGRGKAVLPGFINSHTHTVLTVLRGTVEDMSADAVYGYMAPVSFAITPAEREAMTTLGCLEAIRSGSTTLVENFRFVGTYAAAMAATGLRLYFSENCTDALLLKIRHGEYTYDRAWGEDFLGRMRGLIDDWHGRDGGRIQCQVAAHATDNCSPWMLGELRDLAVKHGLRRTVHLAQSMGEVRQVQSARNRTPAAYLKDEGWAAEDVVGAHWTFCTESDIDLLAEHGVHLAHCPANSSRRGPHKARLDRIRDRGVNIAFGTDNMTEDMFQAMKIGIIVHRGSYGGGIKPAPQAMLDAVTRDGARALGRLHELGTIEAGKIADLTIIDLDQPAMRPVISLISNLVHYGHPGIVDSVMVGGEFLMREGRVLAFDERAVMREAQAATEAVWRRMLKDNPDISPPSGAAWLG